MGWFDCQHDSSWMDKLMGCSDGAMTQEEQLAAMRGNFGGHADPAMVEKAVSDWNQYLSDTGYTDTIEQLREEDSLHLPSLPKLPTIDWNLVILIGVGVVGLVSVMGSGGPRRYGR